MKSGKDLRKELANELKLCADLIESEPDPRRQNYYFSAAYTQTNRVLNIDYDRDLLLMECVLGNAYNQIQARLNMLATGDRTADLPKELFSRLAAHTRQLSKVVEKGESPYSVLSEIWEAAYSSTGNGFYLLKKGVL